MLAAAFKLKCGNLPGLVRHTAVGTCQPVSLAQAAWHRWLVSNVEALKAPAGQISANLKESRGVLRLHGEDIHQFLNGIITNNPKLLQNGTTDVMYTALLNSHGRFMHDAFLCATGEPFGILADVDKEHLPDLVKMLNRYKLRAKVTVEDVSQDYDVWTRFNPSPDNQECQRGWPQDPRLKELGQRAILPKGTDTGSNDHCEDPPAAYRRLRHTLGIAEGPSEIPQGSAVPLEYNLDGLNAISFSKGCYVGQELVARTHFQGMVRKRLMPIALQDDSAAGDVEAGTSVFAEGSARPVGKIVAMDGAAGMAVIRLEVAFGLEESPLHVGQKDGPLIRAQRPSWWPQEWGQEQSL
ncbi:g10175 [Coccomyxa viridis]|uniref:G10175 protein n=1 Tax=Coccomyxa viridis TaxID=1274662 RepID=A0ABP1G8Z2_9CHLO